MKFFKGILKIIITIMIFSLFISGCDETKETETLSPRNPISLPDNIIIYKNGVQAEVDKKDSRFKQIVSLTNKRLSSKTATVLDHIDDKAVEQLKKDTLGLEFIYSTEHNLSIKSYGFTPFKYYRLFFPLINDMKENKQRHITDCLQHGDKEHYLNSSRGPLVDSKELIELLKNYK